MNATNLIPLSDIESIVRPIVQKAIDAAAEVLRTEFLKLLDDRITQLEQTVRRRELARPCTGFLACIV